MELGSLLVGLGVIIVIMVALYNSLVRLRIRKDNAWSDIGVFLKKRHDLIPNLVETVKGYTTHESETLTKIIKARNSAVNSDSPQEQLKNEEIISGFMPKIFALAEKYPDLKASTNFQELSQNLAQIESEISSARRYYNAVVRDLNSKIQMFPSNIVANLFSFQTAPFYEVSDSERANPQVKF